jgi:hypothetical protein
MCHTNTPIDLAAAHRIARGKCQRRWLAEMLTPAGLAPHIVEDGASFRRIEAFADRLALAGYATQLQPMLGPRFYVRIVITGYVPAAAPLLAAIRANTGPLMSPGYQTVSQCEVLAWVEQANPEVVDAAAAIALWFTGSLEELLAVAPGIAQRPGRSSPHVLRTSTG